MSVPIQALGSTTHKIQERTLLGWVLILLLLQGERRLRRSHVCRLLLHGPIRRAEQHAPPLEFPPDPAVPQNLHRARLLDDPDKRDLEHAGADADLDARHWGEGDEVVADLALLVGFLGSCDVLSCKALSERKESEHMRRSTNRIVLSTQNQNFQFLDDFEHPRTRGVL